MAEVVGKLSTEALLNHPELRNQDAITYLYDLLKRYPFHQTARLLLLQTLYENHSPMFHKELQHSAILLANRQALFYMLEGERYVIKSVKENAAVKKEEQKSSSDRTLSLINGFLDTFPNEASEIKVSRGIVDPSTDYMAYLESMENESQTKEIKPTKKPGRRSTRIKLEEKENYDTPEETNLQKEEFFTATLANIYIKQQKYEQALEIIRSISADNPQKNRYFADQIQFLEKLIQINNKKI